MLIKQRFKTKIFLVIMSILTIITTTLTSCNKDSLQGQLSNNDICKSNFSGDASNNTTSFETMPPIIHSNLPTFSFDALYVVTKEYESAEDGTSRKIDYNGREITSYSKSEYLEARLIDLYPYKAYEGITEESQNFYDSLCSVYNSYPETVFPNPNSNRNSLSTTKNDEELIYISDENEMKILCMNDKEIAHFRALIELARMENFATIDDINKINTIKTTRIWADFGFIAVALGSYVYNRAQLCRARTELKTRAFYNNDGIEGKTSDAFKHIFVNVQLRRNLTRVLAYMIMDVYWERTHPNKPCDKYMDWHNNYVGRVSKYSDFRVSNDWETWADNVYNYTSNNANAVKTNWTKNTPESTVKEEEKNISDYKYIYYQ